MAVQMAVKLTSIIFFQFRSWKCFLCIHYPWKHASRRQDCWSTSCNRGDTQFKQNSNGGPDGGQNNLNNFVLNSRSWNCLRCFPYPWKHKVDTKYYRLYKLSYTSLKKVLEWRPRWRSRKSYSLFPYVFPSSFHLLSD